MNHFLDFIYARIQIPSATHLYLVEKVVVFQKVC